MVLVILEQLMMDRQILLVQILTLGVAQKMLLGTLLFCDMHFLLSLAVCYNQSYLHEKRGLGKE